MNKEYIYMDGKAIISDEQGNLKLENYYEALDEVLAQENLVEEMEKQILELTKEQEKYSVLKKHYIPIVLPLLTLLSTAGANIIFYVCTGTNPLASEVNTIFGPLSNAAFISLAFGQILIPIGAIAEYCLYKVYKSSKKEQKGNSKALEYLKEQIVKEKQILEELKKGKEKELEEEVKTFPIDDEKQLEKLQTIQTALDYYYNLGYNGEETLEEGPKLIKRKK